YPQLSLANARDLAREARLLARKGTDPIFVRKEREREERELERARKEAEVRAREEAARQKYTFDRLANDYLEKWAKKRKRSWKGDEWYIKKVLSPEFGNRPAEEVKRQEIVDFLDRIVERGTPVKANRALACISKIFNWGFKKGKVTTTPCVLIDKPGAERQRERVLSDEEIRQLWKALDAERPLMADSFRLRLLTAQRRGEVMGMRWSEIEDGLWTIPGCRTKNKRTHCVPMSPQALRILDRIRRANQEKNERAGRGEVDWVFPNPRRTGPVYEDQKAVQRIRAASGLDFKAHDLRRTVATKMTKLGITNRFIVGKILNHSESGVTKVYDVYDYLKEKKDALNAWGRHMAQIVSDLRLVETEGKAEA
ncbi:MAG: site-specific integrase, partial [Deltaproteobacteria bacterium]|nr:site-specific integrase [Deltaproteobacteria bacterium]